MNTRNTEMIDSATNANDITTSILSSRPIIQQTPVTIPREFNEGTPSQIIATVGHDEVINQDKPNSLVQPSSNIIVTTEITTNTNNFTEDSSKFSNIMIADNVWCERLQDQGCKKNELKSKTYQQVLV